MRLKEHRVAIDQERASPQHAQIGREQVALPKLLTHMIGVHERPVNLNPIRNINTEA